MLWLSRGVPAAQLLYPSSASKQCALVICCETGLKNYLGHSGRAVPDLLVDQVLLPNLAELVEPFLPILRNPPRVLTLRNRIENRLVSENFDHLFHAPLLRVELAESGGQLNSEFGRIENASVQENQINPFALLSRVVARIRRKRGGHEAYACNLARSQELGQFPALNPRSTQQFERSVGASPDGNIGPFDQCHSGIQGRLGNAPQIRRWIDPGQSGGIEPVPAQPTLGGNHMQIGIDSALSVEHSRQFPQRHCVPYRNLPIICKVFPPFVGNRALKQRARDGIRPIQ